MKIALIGGPNSGKGTLKRELQIDYDLPYLSSGLMFKRMAEDGTSIGLEAKKYWGPGGYVPDEIVTPLVEEFLGRREYQEGFLLDGYPRTGPQAASLDKIAGNHIPLLLEAPNELLIQRSLNRRVCSKRGCDEVYNLISFPPEIEGECNECHSDLEKRDDDEKIEKRIGEYEMHLQGVINHYGSRLKRIDSSKSPKQVFEQAISYIEAQNP